MNVVGPSYVMKMSLSPDSSPLRFSTHITHAATSNMIIRSVKGTLLDGLPFFFIPDVFAVGTALAQIVINSLKIFFAKGSFCSDSRGTDETRGCLIQTSHSPRKRAGSAGR